MKQILGFSPDGHMARFVQVVLLRGPLPFESLIVKSLASPEIIPQLSNKNSQPTIEYIPSLNHHFPGFA